MPESELFLLFVRPLNSAGVRYVISGSVAAIFYGEPRYTQDLDIVAFLNDSDISKLPTVFPPTDFYVPPAEVIVAEVAREHHAHFNIIHMDTSFKMDVYPTGRDELNGWAFRNKRRIEFEGETLVLAPPEYVIVRKLEYFREGGSEKHLRDIRGILKVSGQILRPEDLNFWIQRQSVEAQWKLVNP